ncbi:MAG TPA: hypothetical protein VG605_07635 [Puia sp.]|nr:hypothetical protein [Puia sp.]
MPTTLFDVKERISLEPDNYNSNAYDYYNDSARVEIGTVRDELEKWFAQYPEDWKQDLKQSFKAAFSHAFYELYIHQLFTRLGYQLEVHPDMPDKQTHPDFLAIRNSEKLYIEVRHLDLRSDKEKGLENSINTFYDSINDNVDPTNFFIYLRKIVFKSGSQPSGKAAARAINQHLAQLNPDHLLGLLKDHGFDAVKSETYEDDRLLLEYAPIPKSVEGRGVKTRPIGMILGEPVFGDDSDRIETALERKSSRYGQLAAPFIICLNKQTPGLDKLEFQKALWGNIVASWSENPNNRDHRTNFDFTGFFGSTSNPAHTRVSAVYFTNANSANLGSTAEHMIRQHHRAQYPISQTLSDELNQKSIAEIFGIQREYPFNKKMN